MRTLAKTAGYPHGSRPKHELNSARVLLTPSTSARYERKPAHTYKNYRRWFRYHGGKRRVVDGTVLPGKKSDANWSANFRSPGRDEVTDTQLGPISLTLRGVHTRCAGVNGSN
jgi:hypothetical protein